MVNPAPPIDRPVTVSGALPVFLTVTACEGDTVFVVTLPNDRPVAAAGVVVTAGDVAAATVTVWSANCSCSMFQSVSVPSPLGTAPGAGGADVVSATVIEPF